MGEGANTHNLWQTVCGIYLKTDTDCTVWHAPDKKSDTLGAHSWFLVTATSEEAKYIAPQLWGLNETIIVPPTIH